MSETELMPCYLMFASTHPDEGPMLFVDGRGGVERALATQLVFGCDSVEALSDDHRDELAALMEQFDDPDEWSGCQFMWSFEDGGVCVVRLAPEAIAAWNRRSPVAEGGGWRAITPMMLKAAWAEARRWWPLKVVEFHDCAACKQTKGLRVVETCIRVDEPQPGFREAIDAALKQAPPAPSQKGASDTGEQKG